MTDAKSDAGMGRGDNDMSIDAKALKERIYALEADLDTAQHADHEETIRALVVAADRLAALEVELASMRTDRYESRATTHADVCWSWGPAHYECAVGQIRRDEALLRQVLEVLSRAHQTAMEQTLKARIPECAEFAGIAQDLDFVVAALRERLGEGDQP